MLNEKRAASMRALLNEPDPQPWKADEPGDELVGEVRHMALATFKDREIWALSVDTADGPFRVLLSKDLEDKLVRERDVRPGDAIAMRLTGISGKSGFKTYKVVVDPERPRTTAAAETANPWGYDDDGVPLPEQPFGDEPAF